MRQGTLRLALSSRDGAREGLSREVRAPQAATGFELDTSALPWGAYDLKVSFVNATGRTALATQRTATVLPGGAQQIRVLNNLVSELMDARARGLLQSRRIEFMNPRHGWVWFRAAGAGAARLGDEPLLTAIAGQPAAEAMRLLPAGRHALLVNGALTDLVVRAIPALVYNVYPSTPQITPFGANTWARLKRYTLPNCNLIESQAIDTPEHREWLAQGKLWIANAQAPGLIDQEVWTPEKMLDFWRRPRGWDLARLGGIQSDEYYPGLSTSMILTTARSVAKLSEDPAFAGKLWIPFVVAMYGNELAELFMKTTIGAGWPFSIEVYEGELPTEAANLANLRGKFRSVAAAWDRAYPGAMRRTIFTPMYAYLPYCTTNRCPQADFRVHLEQQMQLLATDPRYFGLWGVQPYRSNYVDEEILNCMGRLLRHYCVEGRTDRLLSDPYELRHLMDPDFEAGGQGWQLAPAEDGSLSPGRLTGYGNLQGRYPGGAYGDAFLLLTRSAKQPNRVRQTIRGLQAGRLYSLKVITGDYADLQAGRSRPDRQTLAITIDGAAVQPGAFSHPFRSAGGRQPFTAQSPFWMTYHWLQFRATGPTAQLTLSDWARPDAPGAPVGQQVMVNFVELQPVLASE